MNFRNFPDKVETLAREWHKARPRDLELNYVSQYSPTATGACRVEFDGIACFLKPRPGIFHKNCCVAAEKIAADLGYAVGVPVAPVLLRRPHPAQSVPRFTAVSLLSLDNGAPWGFGGQQHIEVFNDTLEALRVFWGWIGDLDHENNDDNLLYEIYSDSSGALVSIDHYRAFGSEGNFSTSQRIDFAKGYSCCRGNPAATQEIKSRIASITDDQLKAIVGTADELLTASEQDYMLDFLRARRHSIAESGGER